MGGWSPLYGLLNFAILSAVLYLVGKKFVIHMFSDRKNRVAAELMQSEQAVKTAETLREEMIRANESTTAEINEILMEANKTAKENSLVAEESYQRHVSELTEEMENERRRIRHTLRKELNRNAAERITSAAAEILAKEEYFLAYSFNPVASV